MADDLGKRVYLDGSDKISYNGKSIVVDSKHGERAGEYPYMAYIPPTDMAYLRESLKKVKKKTLAEKLFQMLSGSAQGSFPLTDAITKYGARPYAAKGGCMVGVRLVEGIGGGNRIQIYTSRNVISREPPFPKEEPAVEGRMSLTELAGLDK